MKFDLTAAAFQHAIAVPANIAPSGTCHVAAHDDTVTVTGDDGVVRVECRAAATVSDTGGAHLPSGLLRGLVDAMPDGTVAVSSTGSIVELHGTPSPDVTDEPFRASMWQVPNPVLPDAPPSPRRIGNLDVVAFATAMNQVFPAVSRDLTNPALTAVSVTATGGVLEAAATDSYRLHVTATEMIDAAAWPGQALIPAAAVRLILALFPSSAPAELHLDDATLMLRSDHATLTTRLVQGTYPNYGPLIPDHRKANAAITVDAARFLGALDRVSPIAKLGAMRVSITAVPEDNLIVVEARAPDTGHTSATVHGDVTGDGFTFAVDLRYLAAAAKSAGSERLNLWWQSDRSPILIGAFGNPDYRAIVMPLHAAKKD